LFRPEGVLFDLLPVIGVFAPGARNFGHAMHLHRRKMTTTLFEGDASRLARCGPGFSARRNCPYT
jgi:hypothetical protein